MKKIYAFNLIELMISLVVIMCIVGVFIPVITKRIKSSPVRVALSEITSSCDRFGSDCSLCYSNKCIICEKTCLADETLDFEACTCVNCLVHGAGCIDCNSRECKKCETGYIVNSNKKCQICSAGTYSTEGSTSCTPCQAGTYSTEGSASCTPCQAGTYSTEGSASCTPCQAGTYSTEGSASCTPCQAGTYSNSNGTGCNNCQAGSYSVEGSASCTPCRAGTYSNSNGTGCNICHAGSYSAASATSCTPCQAGTYSTEGSASCTPCQAGATSAAGATSCITCSSLFSNCSACSSTACTSCSSGFGLSGGQCVRLNCPANTLKITANGKIYCVTQYNMGDKPDFSVYAAGVTVVSANTNCLDNACCWIGTTGSPCNAENGGYSGCNRTQCTHYAAEIICNNLKYGGLTWRLPTSSEILAFSADTYSKNKGSSGLMYCDVYSGYGSANCCYYNSCKGSYDGYCYPYRVWSSAYDSTNAYYGRLDRGSWESNYYDKRRANSVRCVSVIQ